MHSQNGKFRENHWILGNAQCFGQTKKEGPLQATLAAEALGAAAAAFSAKLRHARGSRAAAPARKALMAGCDRQGLHNAWAAAKNIQAEKGTPFQWFRFFWNLQRFLFGTVRAKSRPGHLRLPQLQLEASNFMSKTHWSSGKTWYYY